MNADAKRPGRILKYGAAAGLMIAAWLYLFLGDTAVAQVRRLPRAQRHQEILAKRVAADTRYRRITVGVATMNGGGKIVVQGMVATEADLVALQEIVSSTKPPAPVQYRVGVALK